MRPNSLVLFVTSVSLRARAWRRNKKIVRADHCSTRFERRANLGIVKCCFVRKGQNLDVASDIPRGRNDPAGQTGATLQRRTGAPTLVMTEMQTAPIEPLSAFQNSIMKRFMM